MRHHTSRAVALALTWLAAEAPVALAQDAAPAASGPTHKHYEHSDRASEPGPKGQLAPRLQNLGAHTFPVSTRNKQAQLFMNQGLNLAYAFNHAEARRAFREAARLDPPLAMAYWGQALVLGPNINALMEPNEEPHAYELVQKARSLMTKASPKERALIEALEQRYSGKAEGRTANDRAYADAMREVHRRFPDDLDVATLYIESKMDIRPWGYWMPDGRPHEGTSEIVALAEEVMRRDPKHPGALHLYVHLIEPTSTPERAERAADTLLTLMPAAGHIVHMPSHIYQRVGRYADAMKSNRLAIAADEDYITQCRAQGLYPMAYYPHNIHFLWFAATADGQSKVAIESARKVASKIDDAALKQLPMLAAFRVVPYWALTRFGHWDEMLKEPMPPADAFLRGSWHYARGLALVAQGPLPAAEQELATLRGIMSDKSLDRPLFSQNTGRAVLSAGREVLAGEIAAARRNFDEAITHFEKAVRLEDALIYTEPAEWHYPPRLALGAVLLEAGRAPEAETVYWEDLRRNRDNGWALRGVVLALRAQQKEAPAALVEARFQKAWARADVKLTSSRFGREVAAPKTSALEKD
jgi:tetratricopeptide (TPR) repeat protein